MMTKKKQIAQELSLLILWFVLCTTEFTTSIPNLVKPDFSVNKFPQNNLEPILNCLKRPGTLKQYLLTNQIHKKVTCLFLEYSNRCVSYSKDFEISMLSAAGDSDMRAIYLTKLKKNKKTSLRF